MSGATPRVSVLVVELGRDPLTLRALGAVRRSSAVGALELLLHRNGSGGEVPLAERAAVDRLEATAENLGFGEATNRLARLARGEHLLLLNNDVVVAPRCLEFLLLRLRELEAREPSDHRAMVVPQFRGFDGRLLELGAYVDGAGRARQILRGEPLPRALASHGFDCVYSSAACVLMRRETFLELQGFDGRFGPAYYEDTDFCHRLAERGGRVVTEPRAIAYHVEGATAGSRAEPDRDVALALGRASFSRRWRTSLEGREPAGRAVALAAALWGELSMPHARDRPRDPEVRTATRRRPIRPPRALWLLPEPLLADRAGGDARIDREIETLSRDGFRQIVWSERGGDLTRAAARLDELGVRWGSYAEPARWPGDEPEISVLDEVDDLLAASAPEIVLIWSWSLARRMIPRVREFAPGAAVVVDLGVLASLQSERAAALDLVGPHVSTLRSDELAVCAAADGVVASSRLEAEILKRELPGLPVHSYDVGVYPPRFDRLDPGAGALFLGNFFHPPNLDAVDWWLDRIAPELERLAGRRRRLAVVGTGSERLADVDPEGVRLDPRGWVDDLGREISAARVFVGPLRYGAGTKDKLSQAMRFGRPVVTTSVGAESMPDALRGAMLVEDDPLRFARVVHQLLESETVWEAHATATRRAAEKAWRKQRTDDLAFAVWLRDLLGWPDSEERVRRAPESNREPALSEPIHVSEVEPFA